MAARHLLPSRANHCLVQRLDIHFENEVDVNGPTRLFVRMFHLDATNPADNRGRE